MISEYRTQLLELAKDYILLAKTIDGVNQISLIGSLLTNKKKPKDIDILCCIEDSLDLKDFAKISRRLQGKAGSIGVGLIFFYLTIIMNILEEYVSGNNAVLV